jgi:RimJ/RimL family protein N-acetyltransferase
LEDWFKSKNIKSVELQANYFNEYSRKYLEKCGYEYELVQFRKFI